MSYRKAFALLITAIMVVGITSPFVFTPTGAVTYTTSPAIPMVLLTPTPNPLRQQWSQLVTNNMQAVGITASRVIADWPVVYARALTPDPSVLGLNYSAGGFDALFVGYNMLTDANPYSIFSNTQFAPQSGNYYLWNDSINEALLNNITQTVDTGPAHNAGWLAAIKQWQAYEYSQIPSVTIDYSKLIHAFSAGSNPSGLTVNGSVFAAYQGSLYPSVARFQYTTVPTNASLVYAQTGPAGSDGISLSYYHTNSYYDITVLASIFGEGEGNSLYMRNGGNQPSAFAYAPYMATGMPSVAANPHITGSPLVNYTVSLRHDIYFQNNESLDGRDFVWTTRYTMVPTWGSIVYAYAKHLEGTDAQGFGNKTVYWSGEPGTPGAGLPLDYYTVHVDLPAPWAFAIGDLFAGPIYPSSILLNSSSYATMNYSNWHPTNSSAFALTSFGTGLPVPYHYFGKNGSALTSTGPIGAGPYRYVGYDTANFVHHLVRWDGYFRAAALKAQGFDQIKDYYVRYIAGGTAGVAALKAGDVQVLDTQYHLERNIAVLDPAWSAYVAYNAFDGQELGFNMQSPIWGTGVATPLGQHDPSRAAEAALDVRLAFEYCVPKDAIIKTLMNGFGTIGITSGVCTIHKTPNGTNAFIGVTSASFGTYGGTTWKGSSIGAVSFALRNETADNAQYLAKQYLRAAGYDIVQVVPPSFWESYGLLLAVVELAVVVVLAGFYFYRPRGGKA